MPVGTLTSTWEGQLITRARQPVRRRRRRPALRLRGGDLQPLVVGIFAHAGEVRRLDNKNNSGVGRRLIMPLGTCRTIARVSPTFSVHPGNRALSAAAEART